LKIEEISRIKQSVRQFYETIGWNRRGDTDYYTDAISFDDLRSITLEYRTKCNLRLNRYLNKNGTYLLDIASGSIQFPEFLTFSESYRFHLCGDISLSALLEARKKLSSKGLYVQCDIVNLPFQSNSIDDIISINTIFHVPAAEQTSAFLELYRVLKPSGWGVVVYSWSRYSELMIVTIPYKFIEIILRRFRKLRRPSSSGLNRNTPSLYFHVFNRRWFEQRLRPFLNYEFAVWRSVNVQFLRLFIHKVIIGDFWLRLIYDLEDRYPKFMGKYGAYPIFLIHK